MSYSISVKGVDKAEVLKALAVKFNEVVASQPIHEADREKALAHAADALEFVSVTPSADEEYYLSLSGSLSWRGTYPESHIIIGASINAYATLQRKT